jgi:hypothetical protein
VLSESRWTPSLYLARKIQCAATANRNLRLARLPRADLFASWLATLLLDESDGPSESWKAVDAKLVDTVSAHQEWEEADLMSQHLLLLPEDEQRAAIRRQDSPYRDYLVAQVLLDAELRRHRGTELGRREARLAVHIAEALLGVYHPAFQSGLQLVAAIDAGKLAPTILTDLLVFSWARYANALRALSRIPEAFVALDKAIAIGNVAEIGPYAEAEVAAIQANILLDEGLDFDLACARVEHAIEIFSTSPIEGDLSRDFRSSDRATRHPPQ